MKTELRKRGREGREALSREEVRRRSRMIVRRVLTRPEYRRARILFCYLDADNEVETGEIIRTALEEKRLVAVPLVEEKAGSLRAVLIRDPDRDLTPGFRGIREPVDRESTGLDPREIDLAIVPGTAFDRFGNRLGRGGGYYDRFLPRLRRTACRLGVAFECQMVEVIVPQPHDQAMDMIITEARVIGSVRQGGDLPPRRDALPGKAESADAGPVNQSSKNQPESFGNIE